MSHTYSLNARYYRALPIDAPGYESVRLELPVAKTALIGLHCWNIGCPDGPAIDPNYCVGMGWPQATAEAARIMAEVIRPAMDIARKIGMPVCHVETDWMAHQYPHIPSRRKETSQPEPENRAQTMRNRAHGPNYLTKSPLANMKRAAIVSPIQDEPLVFYTDVLDTYLKTRDITTLIYTGFATNMCILGAEGGARDMLARGYQCILMRDGTVGVETPSTYPEKLATRYGTHIFEWQLGYSTTFRDFAQAFSA
ncbi:MAG: isochorismatase family protein [Gemmatimonadota bacterium]|nr:isochorismatase family protein [Gemmatimonadota bacterium]